MIDDKILTATIPLVDMVLLLVDRVTILEEDLAELKKELQYEVE